MRKNYHLQYKITIIIFVIITVFTSCKKFLDVTPPNVGTLDYAFRNRNEAENYLFTCYSSMQQLSPSNDPGFFISGEIFYPAELGGVANRFQLVRGNIQNLSNPILNFWDYWSGSDGGANLFLAIRRCNIMLENIDKPVDLTTAEKARWIAEVKFLKAYYIYYIARMYGPIPLYKTNFPIDEPSENLQIKREPVDSVFSYVVQLLDESIVNLPQRIANPVQEMGRITKLIALSVKAEVLATAASPLFNGNPDYSNFKDQDGTLFFSTTVDPNKWVKAAGACKAAIEEASLMEKKLYQFIPDVTTPNVSDTIKQLLTIQNAITEKWDINPELIWALNSFFPWQGQCLPRLYTENSGSENSKSAPGNFAVPISVTEMFYSSNGVPISDDKTWDYAGRFSLQTSDPYHTYYIKPNYPIPKLNFRREPRYYASIGFDGGYWFGDGIVDENAMLSVQAQGQGSLSGPMDIVRTNVTAIWPKKLVHYRTSYVKDNPYSEERFRLPRIRLSGLYLLYAECLNEVSGPGAEVYEYIDKVRDRAGLKGVVESWKNYAKNPSEVNTKEGLRKIIHRERRIELCFEAQAGWDLRRWKEMAEHFSTPLTGWNIWQNNPNSFYQPVAQLIPSFTSRDYLWPLSDAAMLYNKKNVQNPLW